MLLPLSTSTRGPLCNFEKRGFVGIISCTVSLSVSRYMSKPVALASRSSRIIIIMDADGLVRSSSSTRAWCHASSATLMASASSNLGGRLSHVVFAVLVRTMANVFSRGQQRPVLRWQLVEYYVMAICFPMCLSGARL